MASKVKIVAAKIPLDVKERGAVACNRFAIFTGLLKMGAIMDILERRVKRRAKLPIRGYVEINKVKTYYCYYGFVNDPDIYKS